MATLMLAAGCTTTSVGSPLPVPNGDPSEGSSSVPPSSDSELPFAGAPKVDDPLDTSQFQDDPCKALVAAQADDLNVHFPGEPGEGPLGNTCGFRGKSDRRALVDVRSLDKYPYGLSATYQAEEDGKWAHFAKLPLVEGYPAVAYGAVDQRDTGGCVVDVGTSDEVVFEVSLQLSTDNIGKKDPCETAAMVAGMVVQTMKAAQ
ncbi:DUF3558 domain-containing protein [Actinophytocola sp. NPDC049390]|uniref:DUF3558 domain-containing protein n=1 Tax=Actinophytocola sp. NPDC049390 TaxID=3363894 RepID=UPI0037B10A05